MQKKLIYILNHYSQDSTQHFFHVVNLLNALADKGVEIVLVIEKCDGAPPLFLPNIQVIAQKQLSGIRRAAELFRILKELKRQNFKKVFIRISAPACIIACMVKGLEVYFWQSGTVKEYNRALPFGKKKLKNLFIAELPFQLVLKLVDWFVTGPESMVDYYNREFGIPKSKIKVLYNDIDVSRFVMLDRIEKAILKQSLKIPADHKVILFVHRLSPVRKTLYYLPYVLKRYMEESTSPSTIILIGDGSEKAELELKIDELGLKNIQMLGGMPNQDIQKYYSVADIFINPTHAEGFPRVLIEAMACGLPMVTTDAGGIRDILPPEQLPYLVDRNNREHFAVALIALSKDPVMLSTLGPINHSWVQRYSTENVAEMYIDVLFEDKK